MFRDKYIKASEIKKEKCPNLSLQTWAISTKVSKQENYNLYDVPRTATLCRNNKLNISVFEI